MSNHSFMFLDTDFKDISKFCMRMEKNIVEGDGVDAVIWAGKIAERITHYITNFVNLDLKEFDQNKKLGILYNNELIPEEIYDQLDSIRQYRNIATHHDLNNELQTAMKVHRMIFNIVCWFYGVYKADESFFKLKYPGVTYTHDESFINKLKNNTAINQNSSGNISLAQQNVDYNIHDIFNQNYVYFNEDLGKFTAYLIDNDKKITIGHFKTKEVAVRKGYKFVLSDDFKIYKNFHPLPEKMENGNYTESKGIDFDEEEGLWTASFNKKDLGYFISESSAIVARKEYIDTLPIPKPKNGSYSDYKEISFDINHKLWYIKKDGEIYEYYDSEEEAIYNLTNILNLNIPLEKLGIVKDSESLKWRIYFKNKYVATCDSEEEAINKRLDHVSSFAQPKRNKDGEFSIHKGIFYDEKNLIWTLRIKGELLGFFDSEEDAFNFKKEFLKEKGFDVSNLIFHEEESFDEDFDFKVKINSEENAIVYNEDSDVWIVHFRGNEIDRCKTELDAKRSRKDYLKSMPYPPRKSDNKYSSFEGIDYDIDSHLWTATYNEDSLGYFDSEEDAFYALKDYLVKEGVDVSDLHFKEPKESIEDKENTSDSILDDESIKNDLDNEESSSIEDLSVDDSILGSQTNENKFVSYYDIFKNKDDLEGKQNNEGDIDFNITNDFTNDLDEDLNMQSDDVESSLKNIEEYKKNLFYGIANKSNKDFSSSDISLYDLESDDEENDYIDDLEMKNTSSEVSDRFSKQMTKHLNLNRKDLKEIKFNCYDLNNFRREIILAYNNKELFISLEGMITKDELRNILSNDYFNNTEELNYKKEDEDYFTIFINLRYGIKEINLNDLLLTFSSFGWEFDLLQYFALNEDLDLNSMIQFESLNHNLNGSNKFSISSSRTNLDGGNKVESTDSNSDKTSSNSKDYLNKSNVSRRKVYTKQEKLISSKDKKSRSKTAKAIIRGGVRVSLEEAQELDNATEEKEIKSTIIDKKPEKVKEFKTTSLGNVLFANRSNEEKEDVKEDHSDSNFTDDIGSSSDLAIDFDEDSNAVDLEMDSNSGLAIAIDDESIDDEEQISDSELFIEDNENGFDIETSLDDDYVHDSIIDNFNSYSDENNLNEGESEEYFDYGDIINEENSNSNLSFDDIFDEKDDELSFEDQLDSLNGIESEEFNDDSDSVDLGVGVSDFDSSADLKESVPSVSDLNEETSSKITVSKPKLKKPKKPKKEKKIAADAFDDKYKNSFEIEHDEENDKWLAYIGGELIKSFDTPKEAVIERKKLLRRKVDIPKKGLNGKYSDEEGVDFNQKERIWTISQNDIIVNFAINEKDAIIKKKIFDLVLNKLNIEKDDFNEEKFDEIKNMDMDSIFADLTDEDFDNVDLSFKEFNKNSGKF